MNQYTLQTILFPRQNICSQVDLFYRDHNVSQSKLDEEKQSLCLAPHCCVSFDTYFNAFSIAKWKKYTHLSNLKIELTYCGKGQLLLINDDSINNVFAHHVTRAYTLDSTETITQTFDFDAFESRGLHSIYLETNDKELVLFSGRFFTETENSIGNVKIAANMCTYHREEYVYRNFDIINKHIISHPSSPIKQNIDFFLVGCLVIFQSNDKLHPLFLAPIELLYQWKCLHFVV